MESRKSRESTDGLAVVKAAAWAWHQRGSGSRAKPARESDASRSTHSPKPSRYKLEALRMQGEDPKGSGSQRECVFKTENTLLDAYEIQCISNQLEGYMNPFRELDTILSRGYGVREEETETQPKVVSSPNNGNGKTKKKKKKWGVFLRRHAVICGRGEDATQTKVSGRPQEHRY